MTKIQRPTTPATTNLKKSAALVEAARPDASAAAELKKLASANKGKGSISGQEMSDAIINATKDPDNQAAGKEFDAIKKFVKEHGPQLSPEAKKVYEVYAKEAEKSRAAGQTGIDFRRFGPMQREMQAAAKPQYKDASASQSLHQLAAGNKEKGSISGREMMDAIVKGTRDLDGQSAAKEFGDIQKFVKENAQLLSPEAKKVFDVYAKAAHAAQGKGQTGISNENFARMTRDMARAATPNYKDLSAGKQLEALAAGNKEPGSISGKEMMDAIVKGTADLDGQAAKAEFGDIQKFVRENPQLLSPEAKATYAVYEKAVHDAKGGKIGLKDFMKMQSDMAKVATPKHADKSMGASLDALAAGNKEPGSISGQELTNALIKGARDYDGQAAGAEFRDAAKFMRENQQLLSPEAKAAFAVYQKYAAAAQARGESGIPPRDFARMSLEMQRAGAPRYGDQSAAAALKDLAAHNKTPGSISGKEMEQAILNATKDLDNQAAGKEFADVAKFVKENAQLLSPQAKATFAIYEQHAKAAQAKGQTGIPAGDYNKMQLEMSAANKPHLPVINVPAHVAAATQGAPPSQAQVAAATQNALDQIQGTFGQLGALFPGVPSFPGVQDQLAQLGEQLMGQALAGVADAIVGALNEAYVQLSGEPTSDKDPLNLGEALANFKKELEGMMTGGETPNATTKMVGEEGGRPPVGPGGGGNATTMMVGEEGGRPPVGPGGGGAVTKMVGENTPRPAPKPGPGGDGPKMTTMAVGEEGGAAPRPGGLIPPWKVRPNPFIPRPDATAAAAVKDLLANNKKPGSISGKEMTEAIIRGTADLDNQAAGKEFAEFKKMVNQHPELLSPEAKKAFAVYEQHARGAQAKGQTGIPLGEYTQMQREMRAVAGPVYTDASAAKQLEGLAKGNSKPGSISGKEMVDAIIHGTVDRDNQAAGKEYKDIAKFVRENEQLLSPEAKKAFAVYESHVKAAQAQGRTGIDVRDFAVMQGQLNRVGRPAYQDTTAAQSLNQLAAGNKQPGSISGNEMTDAILQGTRDLDNQAAGKEYADIAKFVKENEQLLSPEAKRAFAVYERHVNAAKAKGQTGIDLKDSMRMATEMRQVGSPQYQDASAAKQLNALAAGNKKPGSISGQEFANAVINGTRDLDNQAAGKEFKDIAKFVKENEQLLSPEAKRVFAAYEQAAKAAQAKGQSGMSPAEFNKMSQTLNRVAQPTFQDGGAAAAIKDLAGKNKAPGSISAGEMRDAILRGTRDPDAQAAGKEFQDFAKFVKENEQLLSPQAKKVFAAYEKAAKAAQARGETGLDAQEYSKLSREMRLLSITLK